MVGSSQLRLPLRKGQHVCTRQGRLVCTAHTIHHPYAAPVVSRPLTGDHSPEEADRHAPIRGRSSTLQSWSWPTVSLSLLRGGLSAEALRIASEEPKATHLCARTLLSLLRFIPLSVSSFHFGSFQFCIFFFCMTLTVPSAF